MIPEKLLEVLKHVGVVAIATQGETEPHLVNTWNNYIQVSDDGNLLVPAGYMYETEKNIARDNRIWLTIGSHEVAGNMGPGTGFLIKGTVAFVATGADFDRIKAKYAWARAVLVVTVASATQTL